MKVIPAIDLMKGKVVRLSRGNPQTARIYDEWGTPVQVAVRWKSQGAKRLHVIDLDAAFARGDNRTVIADILKTTGLHIQVGGGIRTENAAEELVKLGADRIIFGSLAFGDPATITLIQRKIGIGAVIVALDNKACKIVVEGWKTQTAFTVWGALEKFASLGVNTFLITSVARDGMLSGPDIETLKKACQYPGIEVIAAGGISRLADLVALKSIGVEGVVVGKALYERRFTLKEAMEIVKDD